MKRATLHYYDLRKGNRVFFPGTPDHADILVEDVKYNDRQDVAITFRHLQSNIVATWNGDWSHTGVCDVDASTLTAEQRPIFIGDHNA